MAGNGLIKKSKQNKKLIDNCRNMQRPLRIWTNIAIFKLLMPLIVPRFGGPVKVKMVNIRTHFFHQLFKFAIFFFLKIQGLSACV
jgi:hypothetical protein